MKPCVLPFVPRTSLGHPIATLVRVRDLRMAIWVTPFIVGGVRSELLKLADDLAAEPQGRMTGPIINIPAWDGTMRDVAEVFRLHKDRRTAVCTLVTHPIGGEVRVSVGRELLRSEATRDGLTLVNVALAWKQQFEAKGWQ